VAIITWAAPRPQAKGILARPIEIESLVRMLQRERSARAAPSREQAPIKVVLPDPD